MMYFMPDAADANTPATGPGENPEASASDTNRSTIEDAQYQRREQLLQQLEPNFEVLSMSGQSAFTQLKSLLNQEKALLEAIIPKLSSLEESVKKEFLENIKSPIILPESLSLNATEEIEFKNNLNQLISTREQFEAQIEQVLDTISSANQRAHSEHYKKCTIAMLQSRLGFEPREGLTLRSKLWNDNSTYKIISIDPTASKEIEINNQKRLINDVNFKVQKTDSQSEELFELSSSDFQVLCRGQELQPQIRNLQELTKIHQFDKYGQAIHPGFEFTYTVDGKNELASQIQEYDSEQNLVKFTSPIHWKQETYSELSLESFSQFMYDSKSFEQKLNQTQARTLLETIKNLRSNQIDSINS